MITYRRYVNEAALSNYEYTLPGNLEKEFYDFYVWVYLYHRLENNFSHIGEDTRANIESIVKEALQTVIDKNTRIMKEALLLSIASESQYFQSKKAMVNLHASGLKIQGEKFKLKDIDRVREKINEFFGNEVKFIRFMENEFGHERQSYGGIKWSQICTALLTLYEKSNLDAQILKLDHIYDLEHNGGIAYNKVTDMDWVSHALDFKFKDKKFEIAQQSSIPEHVINYIFNQLGGEKEKRNKRLTAQEIEKYEKHSDAYILFLKTIENGVRNPGMEDWIMKEPATAFEYAMHVIKGRWTEAEPHILEDMKTSLIYAIKIIHGPWPELEQKILDKKNLGAILIYARDVLKKRWKEAEPTLFNGGNQKYIDMYKQMFNMKEPVGPGEAQKENKIEWLKQVGVDEKSIRILSLAGNLDKETQEYILQRRPDLVNQITNLDPELKDKYSHEMNLSQIPQGGYNTGAI